MVEHTLGKGEVESSILSHSTTYPLDIKQHSPQNAQCDSFWAAPGQHQNYLDLLGQNGRVLAFLNGKDGPRNVTGPLTDLAVGL